MTKAKIYYRDIGDYLSRDEKLEIVHKLGSIDNPDMQWQTLTTNEHNDWVNHRNDKFGEFIPLAPEKKFDTKTKAVFTAYSLGVVSSRDSWVFNYSDKSLHLNIKNTISHYNEQRQLLHERTIKEIKRDSTQGSWSRDWLNQVRKNIPITENNSEYRNALYRPFAISNCYFSDDLNQERYQLTKLFPMIGLENLAICISGVASGKDFSSLITNKITSYDFIGKTQIFPLYWYEETKQEKTLFDSLVEPENEFYARRDAISDFALNQARKEYGSKTTKEDIFYYVYGFLHNPDYRTEFAADLKKRLPRISFVDDSIIFWKYVKAGRELAQLHLHYEDYANEAAGVIININNAVYDNFEVTKMRFASKEDKSTIIYNSFITITGIPAEAYEYVVNGRSAIEWIMESYQIKTHKESRIVNDPNDWAREHNKPRYILDLLLSIITISVKTVEIVKGLPKVEF